MGTYFNRAGPNAMSLNLFRIRYSASFYAAFALCTACGSGEDTASTDTGPVLIGDAGDTVGGDTNTPDTSAQPDTAGNSCTVNADCRGGELCREGLCLRACSEASTCDDASQVCDPTLGVCVGCVGDSDCNAGALCINRECVGGCDSDLDCAGGEFCNDDSQCVTPECFNDGDCPGGFRCESRECVSILDPICEPGTATCDGNTLMACNADGTVIDETECDDLCVEDGEAASCVDQICVPDALGCIDSSTAGLCNASGTALDPLPCREDQYCAAGQCSSRVCTPDTVECVGDSISSCNASGSAAVLTPCAETTACVGTALGCGCVDAECIPRVCAPSTSRCVGNASQACNAAGTAYAAPVACGAGQSCESGQCVDPSCTPGATQCSGDTLITCASDGRTRTPTDCTASANICVVEGGVAQCDDRVCTPGTTTCAANGTTRLICDSRGASQTTAACGAGLFCQAGACVELDCDPRTCAQLDAAGVTRPDSDFDGIVDCIEGTSIGPNGLPACADPDQDSDGVADGDETNCAGVDVIRTADSDGDGFGDGLERLLGTNVCIISSTPADLADIFVATPGSTTASTIDIDIAASTGLTDIAILFDSTGSMSIELSDLKNNFQEIVVSELAAEFNNLAWGLATYADFPCSGTGESSDRPFRLRQRVSTNPAHVATALGAFNTAGGSDAPESTLEALYQIATGTGVTGCSGTVPAFDPASGRIAGIADGPRPGIGFRTNATPVVIHITDAVSHEAEDYTSITTPATRAEAMAAMNDVLDARYIGIVATSTTSVLNDLTTIASALDASLPVCAWNGHRPTGCTTGQCCTGNNGVGATASAGGLCPAVASDTDAESGSLTGLISSMVGAVLRSSYQDGIRPARVRVGGATIDPTRVIVSSQISSDTGSAVCGSPTTVAATGTWNNVYPGAQLTVRASVRPAELSANTYTIIDVNAVNTDGAIVGSTRVLVARY